MHKVTAVVFSPRMAAHFIESIKTEATQLYEFEVAQWYDAFDTLIREIEKRQPASSRTYGVEDLEIKAITIMKVPD